MTTTSLPTAPMSDYSRIELGSQQTSSHAELLESIPSDRLDSYVEYVEFLEDLSLGPSLPTMRDSSCSIAITGRTLAPTFRQVGLDPDLILVIIPAIIKAVEENPIYQTHTTYTINRPINVGQIHPQNTAFLAKTIQSECAYSRHRRALLYGLGSRGGEPEDDPWIQAQTTEPIEATFQRLKEQWYNDTKFVSSGTKIINHPAYKQIINLGSSVIPLIIEELRQGRGHWFSALHKLTGHSPAEEHRGNMGKMRDAWLQWADEHIQNP